MEEAINARTWWIQQDWNLDIREEYLKTYRGERYNRNPVNKHINKNGKAWSISRTVDGENLYYGTYPYLSTARRVRDQLIENDWDTRKVRIRKKERNPLNRYITRNGRYWEVRRTFTREDGTPELIIYDSGIHTIEEARKLRDWWEEHNWDWSEIE